MTDHHALRFLFAPFLALSLAACDGGSSKAPTDAAMAVVDRAPVITSLLASPPTVQRAAQSTLTAVAADPDGDPITYAWLLPSGWTFLDSTKSTLPSVTIVAPDQPGAKAMITLTVSDGRGKSATGTVVVSTPADNGPIISSISAVPNLVKKSGTVDLAVSASSPDNLALTYAWTAPTGWTLTTSTSGMTASLVAPDTNDENATIGITVTDSAGASVSGSVLVATSADSPPSLNSLSVDASKVLPSTIIHALASATDPDGDPLAYVWTTNNTDWTVVGTGNAAVVTAPAKNGSTATLTVTLRDGLGGSTSGSVLLTTSACGAGAANCDGDETNGCETDTTTTTNCGGCGIVCGSGQVCDHGAVCRAPEASCEAIIEKGESLGDGVYDLLPTGATTPIAAYCDMTTDGGGWTGFYAGINGESNAFNHFELAARDCTDPTKHCMQRIPSDQTNAEVMATCGGAKLGFHMASDVFNYFSNGQAGYGGFYPISNDRVIAGTLHVPPPGGVWIGYVYSPAEFPGFVIGDGSTTDTFSANGGTYTNNPDGYDYCNGSYDKTSSIGLFYRSKVARLEVKSSVNQSLGSPFDIQVIALDPAGLQVPTFADTLHFAASNTDFTVPADYTFDPASAGGAHTFQATLTAPGPRTITITDTSNPSLPAITINAQVAALGSSAQPAASCLSILNAGAADGDGVYWLDTGAGAFTALCDMTTAGGGWTNFYAGKNGSPNAFDYFELTSNDCSDQTSHCMRRLPVSDPTVLATCGSAKVSFGLKGNSGTYFENGVQNGWVDVTPTAISAGADVTDFTAIWTGGGSLGFILGKPGANLSFMSESNDGSHDYCNGVADTSSPTFLYYRELPASQLTVSADATTAPGATVTLHVSVLDANGVAVTGYTGTVAVTSTDTGATLPASHTFVTGENGSAEIDGYVTGATATGTATITVTDTTTASITGSASVPVTNGLGTSAQPAASCNAILTGSGAGGDGLYTLTDGTNTWLNGCDMTTDGGGWTLVLKANGNNSTFAYGSALWTSNATYHDTAASFDTNEAKLASWNSVAFTTVLVEMGLDVSTAGKLEIPQSAASMYALMSPNTVVTTMLGHAAWVSLQPEFALQPNCNTEEGFNVVSADGIAIRIGALANEQNDCGSDDSRLGIGGAGAGCFGDPGMTVGDGDGCDPLHSTVDERTYGWVLVR